jgi:hypothetical protein
MGDYMQDKPFLVAFDGVTENTGGPGMGDNGGYPERKHWNVGDISQCWYLVRDRPHVKDRMRFYRLVEIPQSDGFALLDAGRLQHEREQHARELKEARDRVRVLEAQRPSDSASAAGGLDG